MHTDMCDALSFLITFPSFPNALIFVVFKKINYCSVALIPVILTKLLTFSPVKLGAKLF